MDFVDFVEKYQQELTPEQMLAVAKAVGKYLSCKLSDVEEHHLCAMVYGVLSEEHFDKHFADDAICKMWYEDADGTKHMAPFFTDEEIREAFDKHQDDISDYTIYDLAVTMNLLRSDHHLLLESSERMIGRQGRCRSLPFQWLYHIAILHVRLES